MLLDFNILISNVELREFFNLLVVPKRIDLVFSFPKCIYAYLVINKPFAK